jgi:hypothetical protein
LVALSIDMPFTAITFQNNFAAGMVGILAKRLGLQLVIGL